MQVLLCSNWFAPFIGGVETSSQLMAEEFVKAGNSVTVVTSTPSQETGLEHTTPYSILRNPSIGALRAVAKKSDVVFQNLISLRTLLPLIGLGKPIVITHQSWMRRHNGSLGPENHAKRVATRFCTNVSISKAIADSLPVPSTLIPNPFDAKEFGVLRHTSRDKDIVFMGRLVSDKGCDGLLHALAELKKDGLTPTVSIIGDGPEAPKLKQMAEELGLAGTVHFFGAVREGRGELVARHRIMVVPSIWAEPFGIVALEGIAAGCAIVASEQGGLPDAAGDCSLYFPNRDWAALADRLKTLLTNETQLAALTANGPKHIMRFQPDRIAARYLGLFESLL